MANDKAILFFVIRKRKIKATFLLTLRFVYAIMEKETEMDKENKIILYRRRNRKCKQAFQNLA